MIPASIVSDGRRIFQSDDAARASASIVSAVAIRSSPDATASRVAAAEISACRRRAAISTGSSGSVASSASKVARIACASRSAESWFAAPRTVRSNQRKSSPSDGWTNRARPRDHLHRLRASWTATSRSFCSGSIRAWARYSMAPSRRSAATRRTSRCNRCAGVERTAHGASQPVVGGPGQRARRRRDDRP